MRLWQWSVLEKNEAVALGVDNRTESLRSANEIDIEFDTEKYSGRKSWGNYNWPYNSELVHESSTSAWTLTSRLGRRRQTAKL